MVPEASRSADHSATRAPDSAVRSRDRVDGNTAVAPVVEPVTRGPSLIGLRSVVGNQAMTQIIHRREAQSLRAPRARSRRGHFAVPPGASPMPPVSHESRGSACIQRHSAFEHYLLGQVAPTKLSEIPQVREIPELQKQLAALEKQVKKAKAATGKQKTDMTALQNKIMDAQAKREDVKHTITQEMDRLLAWKDDPEAAKMGDGELGQAKKTDEVWNVPKVKIPCKDGAIVVSYSEINTLPDLFGNPEAIAKTPKSKVLGLLQGVRQQAYIELDNLYTELFGKSRNVLHNTLLPDGDFEGARGPRAQAVNEKAYEIRMESQVNSDTKRKGEESDAYFAALERNACHFFPENRIQWTGYHKKARDLAEAAATEREAAEMLKQAGSNKEAEALEKRAAELGNEAMLQNAFGEHYLQDAYAGGHLVNKTAIMQWFVQWLDSNGGLGSTDLGEAQFAMAKHAANSKLKSNPQALDDKIKRGELGSMGAASAEIGMGNKPEIVFMMKWRRLAVKQEEKQNLTPAMAAAEGIASRDEARTHMRALVDAGFAERDFDLLGQRFFRLKQKMIDAAKGSTFAPYKSTQQGKDKPDFEEEASEFNLASYNQFLSNAYIQGATKFFHDKYCKEGLDVVAANGDRIWTVYGDNNMLKAGGQAGVLYQSTTSKWSREAIFELIAGNDKKAHSVSEILGRFPMLAKENGGPSISLDDWNEQLHQRGINGLFAEARSYGAKILSKAKPSGSISGGAAIDIPKLNQTIQAEAAIQQHDNGSF
jgi:hypothetical protein